MSDCVLFWCLLSNDLLGVHVSLPLDIVQNEKKFTLFKRFYSLEFKPIKCVQSYCSYTTEQRL